MPEFAWIIEGNLSRTNPSEHVPGDAKEWTREKFGATQFPLAVEWKPENWVKVKPGIYLLHWNREDVDEEDWTKLFIPHPMVIDLTSDEGNQNCRVWRLAPKEHEAWRDVPIPSLWHSVEIYTGFWDKPAVKTAVPILTAVGVGAVVTKALDWW